MKINICFTSDRNYRYHLASSMASILKNAYPETELCFFILENDFNSQDKNTILKLKEIKDCEIDFIKVSDSLLSEMPKLHSNLEHISKITYAKFLIPLLLRKSVDKVIYLDCDTIVLQDLSSLFMENIEDYYIAGVEDMGYYFNLQTYKNLASFDIYVNMGVALVNLNAARKENFTLALCNIAKERENNLPFADQCALNILCKDKIKLLDFSYNIQTDAIKPQILSQHPKKQEIDNAIKQAKIVHYTTKRKPWIYPQIVPLAQYYRDYEKFNPFISSNKPKKIPLINRLTKRFTSIFKHNS